MSRGARISAGVLLVVLVTVGLLAQQPGRELSRSSFGTAPFGFKAVHDLLVESGASPGRNLSAPAQLPPDSTVWWLAPATLCRGTAADDAGELDEWSGATWLASGGTAVVFLDAGFGAPICAHILGVEVPARTVAPRADATSAAAAGDAPCGEEGSRIAGTLPARPRCLPGSVASVFDVEDPGVATIGGKPFVLETAVGDGRVVLVASDDFLTNASLDRADAALLAMDLVRAYGTPLIDEHEHGFGAAASDSLYLLRSPALATFAGLALLGLTFAWWGAALPPRVAAAHGAAAPTLESYVDSLATLYARAPDVAAAAAQYRDLTLAQIRRRLGLAPDTPARAVVERLQRHRRLDAADAARLLEAPEVASPDELSRLAHSLDDIERKATR